MTDETAGAVNGDSLAFPHPSRVAWLDIFVGDWRSLALPRALAEVALSTSLHSTDQTLVVSFRHDAIICHQ